VNEPVCLIPAQFEYNRQRFWIGNAEDAATRGECFEVGRSTTKHPKSYVIGCRGGRLRMVDTPGIGDSDGIDQDRRNFDNTLAYVARIHELHAICILLKPNQSVLTAHFKYCIGQLLTRLHKSAAANIVFCFTNARGSIYDGGIMTKANAILYY
jgi:hypothetical protein